MTNNINTFEELFEEVKKFLGKENVYDKEKGDNYKKRNAFYIKLKKEGKYVDTSYEVHYRVEEHRLFIVVDFKKYNFQEVSINSINATPQRIFELIKAIKQCGE